MTAIFEKLRLLIALDMMDSNIPSTRYYWRREFFGACEEDAKNPAPFVDVIKARERAEKSADLPNNFYKEVKGAR